MAVLQVDGYFAGTEVLQKLNENNSAIRCKVPNFSG